MVDTNAAAGKALEAELKAAGHKVLYASADVGQFAECEAAFSAIKAELGPIDILVNNVGISPKHDGKALKVWEMSPQRSEERRVGKECVSTCRSRWEPYH